MIKKYKIYELVKTSLESKREGIDWSTVDLQSYLLRSIDYEDWTKSRQITEGFNTLEEAEGFIEENIEDYDNWTIITEYAKEV